MEDNKVKELVLKKAKESYEQITIKKCAFFRDQILKAQAEDLLITPVFTGQLYYPIYSIRILEQQIFSSGELDKKRLVKDFVIENKEEQVFDAEKLEKWQKMFFSYKDKNLRAVGDRNDELEKEIEEMYRYENRVSLYNYPCNLFVSAVCGALVPTSTKVWPKRKIYAPIKDKKGNTYYVEIGEYDTILEKETIESLPISYRGVYTIDKDWNVVMYSATNGLFGWKIKKF